MIHQKNLRLGDLVQITVDLPEYKQGDTFVVIDISEDYIGLRSPDKSDGRPDMYTIGDHIEGVPLTPEILEKNGWKEKAINYYYNINDELFFRALPNRETGGVELEVYNNIAPESYDVCQDDFYLGNTSFVHQLQHILWALGLDANLKI